MKAYLAPQAVAALTFAASAVRKSRRNAKLIWAACYVKTPPSPRSSGKGKSAARVLQMVANISPFWSVSGS